jgi:kynurenine formamidase
VKIIDLTHEIHTGMMAYPGDPEISLEEACTHEADGCHVDYLMCGSHAGTHIDAPYHFLPEGKRITDFPVSRFLGEGVVCDLRHKKADEAITAEDLEPLREKIRQGDFLILQTGWCEKYGEEAYYNHPYLAKETAELLVAWGVRLVAVDFLNVDPTLWEQWDVHPVLLGNEVLIVENLAGSLALDPDRRYRFCFAPIKLRGSDGAPIRAFAVEG